MERSPKGIYTPEFRAEAVTLVETTGMSVARAAKQLSIPKSSLDNWVRASRKGQLADVGKGQRLPTELELELARDEGRVAARLSGSIRLSEGWQRGAQSNRFRRHGLAAARRNSKPEGEWFALTRSLRLEGVR